MKRKETAQYTKDKILNPLKDNFLCTVTGQIIPIIHA